MKRDEVARNQRARLYGAMIEAIAQHGYGSTTVAHVIGLAGVSRRAFYEHFRNKEDCFIRTFNIVLARSRKNVLRAWGSERGWDNRLHAAYRAFLEEVADEPKGAHLMLIDSLGTGVRSRERLHLVGYAYECMLAEAFAISGDPVPLPRIASRAIVGGVRHVVYRRMREERLPELRTIADELLDWIEAYRTPMLKRLNTMINAVAPEIPLATCPFLNPETRRGRMLGAVVSQTMDVGYGELTDPFIAKCADVSTEAFHKEFRSKEECYLVAIEEFTEETVAYVERIVELADTWPEGVALGIRSFTHHAVARPALLRLAFVDLFELGPCMIDGLTTVTDRLTDVLLAGSPEPRRAPAIVREAVAGAVWDVFGAYAASDRMRYLPCLADYVSYFVLAPYIGAKDAIDAIEAAGREPKILLELSNCATAAEATTAKATETKATTANKTKATTANKTKATTTNKATAAKAATKAGKGKTTAAKAAAGKAAQAKAKAEQQGDAKERRLPLKPSTANRARRRPPQ